MNRELDGLFDTVMNALEQAQNELRRDNMPDLATRLRRVYCEVDGVRDTYLNRQP